MMKRPFVLVVLMALALCGQAQKYVVEKSMISFYSHASIEDISAKNEKIASIFNAATGEIVFQIPISEFQFAKSLMQEHFNEKYMESDKYPKASFQGVITGYDASAKGAQQLKAKGKLTIHGVTKEVEIPGTLEKQGDKLSLKSKFIVILEEYNIARPQLLWKNIAEQVEVTAELMYKPQ
jgi:polyisoprenoid-binding protein YceI